MTAKAKRRKVWVNWYGAEPKLHVTRLSAQKLLVKSQGGVTVPFVESRPGDVVLSREDVAEIESYLRAFECCAMRHGAATAEVRALLRGGR